MATDKKDTEEAVVRPFADFLRDQNKGRTHDELSETLHQLIGRIRETGKKGDLVLTISIEPNKKNPDVLQVSDRILVKTPQPERRASIFYTDGDGNLTGTDPNQLAFETLREVPPAAPAQIKTPKENRA
jgi:hypothetical protein